MANIKATQTSQSDEWATPTWLFDVLHKEFNFTCDVAASAANAKLPYYYSKAEDGLIQKWSGTCFMNPPYSNISKWMQKAFDCASTGSALVVCVVPARTDTRWWWNTARWGEVRFLKGRLRFNDGKTGAPFPSAVVIFQTGWITFRNRTQYWTPDC